MVESLAQRSRSMSATFVILPHEVVFNAFLMLTALRYFVVTGATSQPPYVYLALLIASGLTFWLDRRGSTALTWRLRLGWYALAMSIVFNYMRGTIGAIAGPAQDNALLAADIALFGTSPTVWFQAIEAMPLGEVLSFCYVLFFPYLYGSLIARLCGERATAERFFSGLFSLYGIGFLFYSLVPAFGPSLGEPQLFAAPIANGPLANWVLGIVLAGSNGADVFPSLHIAVTLYILLFDRKASPRRFAVALIPASLLMIATLYLRFHYGVDIIAGALLALAMQLLTRLRLRLPNA